MPTDPTQWTAMRRARAGELFDLLAGAPDGLTKYEIADALDVAVAVANSTIRDLRIILGDDEINVTATPQGYLNPWKYELAGSYAQARPWLTNRVGDLETRLETIESVSLSLTNATDGRTIEGRKARKINRTITYLREELSEIGS